MNATKKRTSEKQLRFLLGTLLLLLAANAFGGGYYGMAGAKDIPVEWLHGSPFSDYFIPGLFLFTVIGGSAVTAAIAVFIKHRHARKAAFICGSITVLWIVVQVSIIGYVSWMQPVTAITALLILLLTWRLPIKEKYPLKKYINNSQTV